VRNNHQLTQLKETKLLSDSDSTKRSALQTDIQMYKEGFISQTLKHQVQVNLAILFEVPVLLYLVAAAA